MNNKIETNLFWINNFRSELSLYSEAMSLFCGIILYHISDFNEPFSTALRNSLVKTALTNLTVCIYKMNPNASKEDVATSIRTFFMNISRVMIPLNWNSSNTSQMSILRRYSVIPF
jgi:hypothetical protein